MPDWTGDNTENTSIVNMNRMSGKIINNTAVDEDYNWLKKELINIKVSVLDSLCLRFNEIDQSYRESVMNKLWEVLDVAESESCEIVSKFSVLAINTGFKKGVDKAVEFVGTVGRGKFVLPI